MSLVSMFAQTVGRSGSVATLITFVNFSILGTTFHVDIQFEICVCGVVALGAIET